MTAGLVIDLFVKQVAGADRYGILAGWVSRGWASVTPGRVIAARMGGHVQQDANRSKETEERRPPAESLIQSKFHDPLPSGDTHPSDCFSCD